MRQDLSCDNNPDPGVTILLSAINTATWPLGCYFSQDCGRSTEVASLLRHCVKSLLEVDVSTVMVTPHYMPGTPGEVGRLLLR